MIQPLYTLKEVAALLKISAASVRLLCVAGMLEHHRVGKRTIRISEEAVQAYIEKAKADPPLLLSKPREARIKRPDTYPRLRKYGFKG